ncbi:MAG: endonuclease MutS2 [Fimbriimonadaceae bacterium]
MTHAFHVLEFESIRELLLAQCETELGSERASALAPSFDPDEVWRSLDLTASAHDLLSRHSPPSLGAVRDLRAAFGNASKGATLGGAEILQAASALQAMRACRAFLKLRQTEYPALWTFAEALPEAEAIQAKVFSSLDHGGEVKDSASEALQALRRKKTTIQSRIQEKIQSYVSGKTREYLSDPIFTVREGRYVIPLKAEHKHKIRGIVHDTSGSGQTVFIEPEDVLQLGNQLREVEGAERDEVLRILAALSAKLGSVAKEASAGIEAAGFLDFIFAKAKLGFQMKGVVPLKRQSPGIEIAKGAHPMLDRDTAIPLDLSVGFGHQGLLITGPNTGGKTVAIKAVGLFALMAQSGLMLPAGEVKLGPFSQVWADIGDEQSLQQSLSTFSGHIKNIAEALKGIKQGALVLLDEIGAGTDPAEGASLARAILIELRDKGAIIVASTHYGELKAFAYNTEGFANAAMEFDQKTLRPTYRLIMGAPGASHALKIAERYGIPREVVERARHGLGEAAQDVAKMLEQLESAQRLARTAQGEADRRSAELRKAEETAGRKLAEADDVRRNAFARAQATIDEALRQIRLEATEIFEELKSAGSDPRAQEAARKRLKDLQTAGSQLADELAPEDQPDAATEEIKKGDTVRVEGYAQTGLVLNDPRDGSASVQMGSLKVTVDTSKLQLAKPAKPAQAARSSGRMQLQKAQTATTEVHLRAMRAEAAMEMLERFLDDAVLGGVHQVRIVHGKGEGILRELTREVLRKYRHVASYRDGEPGEGGHGVTVAVMK